MKIRTFLVALVALFSVNAYAVHCDGTFTFSTGGSGTVAFDTGAPVCAGNFLSSVSNLSISITIGGTTWTQSQLVSKYGTPPYGNLLFNVDGSNRWFWDDPDDGSGDTAIAVFTNGPNVLAFDEGDCGDFTFSLNGQPGTYTLVINAFQPPVPAISPIGMALLGLLIAGVAFAMRRRFRGGGNTFA